MRRIMVVVLVFLFILSSQSITQVPAQTFTLDIWLEEGCGAEFHVGDMLKVHWEVSHDCTIIFYEEEPDGMKRKLTTHGIQSGEGHGSRGWTLKDYGYGRRVIHAQATSEYGSDSDSCEFYVVEEEPPDADADGVPDSQDNCYNPGCSIVDSRGCPEDSDGDGINDCEDDCPYEEGVSSNDGCPVSSDSDNDGITDDKDDCYNPGCSIVDSRGCPEDSDGDGINDCEDDCPYDYGEKSNNGCPVTSSPTPTVPPSSTTPSSSVFPAALIILQVIGIGAVIVLFMVRRQRKSIPSQTRTYDDSTRIYDDKTQDYDETQKKY
jgi:hypothetical protein